MPYVIIALANIGVFVIVWALLFGDENASDDEQVL